MVVFLRPYHIAPCIHWVNIYLYFRFYRKSNVLPSWYRPLLKDCCYATLCCATPYSNCSYNQFSQIQSSKLKVVRGCFSWETGRRLHSDWSVTKNNNKDWHCCEHRWKSCKSHAVVCSMPQHGQFSWIQSSDIKLRVWNPRIIACISLGVPFTGVKPQTLAHFFLI